MTYATRADYVVSPLDRIKRDAQRAADMAGAPRAVLNMNLAGAPLYVIRDVPAPEVAERSGGERYLIAIAEPLAPGAEISRGIRDFLAAEDKAARAEAAQELADWEHTTLDALDAVFTAVRLFAEGVAR